MAIEDDFTVNQNGEIQLREDNSGEHYTVLDLHRWLQSLADDPVNNQFIDITSPNPSVRITDNDIRLRGGFTIGSSAAQHLVDGSIQIEDPPEQVYSSIEEEILPLREVNRPTIRLIRE